jgi:hypothetical protein
MFGGTVVMDMVIPATISVLNMNNLMGAQSYDYALRCMGL